MFGLITRGDRPVKVHFKILKGRPGPAIGDVKP